MKTNGVILWKDRFADRAASGLKVDDWYKRNGVTKHAYFYWHRTVQDDRLGLAEHLYPLLPVIFNIFNGTDYYAY
ncbi:IS66 family insertion sequence element accessory protein TnpA [Lacrimispora sp. JR3]|uniref:IS66 family insertion sequence element accessory protein TnpA n=1 Tax=Lacrimispora sinapis TaxID=3111456 RepID=UPI003749A7B1